MNYRLLWLALGAFVVGTGAFVIASLLPGISADMAVSIPQAGSLVLVYAVSYAIAAPVLSTFTGSLQRRPVLAAAMAVFGLANIAAAMSPTFAGLVGTRIAMAAASGLFAAVAQGTAVYLSTPETRTRAIAVIVGGTTISVAFGAPIGSLIANTMSWRAAFLAVGGTGLLVAIALQELLPKNMPGTRLSLRERVMVAFRPGIGSALLVTVATIAGAFTVFTYIAPFTARAGLPIGVLPLVLLGFGIGSVIGNYASGQLADKFGASRTVTWVIASAMLILALMTGVSYWLPAPTAGWVLLGLMVPWGVIGWGFPPAQSSRIVSLAPEAAGISLSLNVSAIYVGVALGSVVGGYTVASGATGDLGLVAAGIVLVALVVHRFANRRVRRPALA